MKISNALLLISVVFFQNTCSNNKPTKINSIDNLNSSNTINSALNQTFSNDWKTLTKDFNAWYNYTYYNIKLSEDFTSLDTDSTEIGKDAFLKKLISEKVVAFKTKIKQGKPVYQLFKLGTNADRIIETNKQTATTALSYFKMEGVEMPAFSFTNLNGKEYNKANTKGKILILKCWFIGCVACVKEFPELNTLVEKYESRNDILFISLAIDNKKDLSKFLKTRTFKYQTVPEMKDYMISALNVSQYPTHLLIDKEGKIRKVVNKIEELIPFLNLETEKNTQK